MNKAKTVRGENPYFPRISPSTRAEATAAESTIIWPDILRAIVPLSLSVPDRTSRHGVCQPEESILAT